MLTGEIRNQVDAIWNTFWSGGIANPLEVIEQITYLLFIRRLDDLQLNEEAKAARLGTPVERRIFPAGNDGHRVTPRPYDDYRWSRFRHFEAKEMYDLVADRVFPFLRSMGGEGSTYAQHMKDARFTIPKPALLAKVVDLISSLPMEERDTKGDLYEYMLGKIASAGQNGQFRTPRHIIRLMVELVAPTPEDVVCDPACGTAGFLVAVGEYLRERHPEIFHDQKKLRHFHEELFHGFDFDSTMLRIGSMNMLLHGVEHPDITYRDSLSQEHADEEEKYTLLLANPPFAGSLDYEGTAKDLLQIVKTKKTELLFFALFLKLLKPGGRAAVIVPTGVLGAESGAHEHMRRLIVNGNTLEAVIALPHWVFKPYASVATAILVFVRGGSTDSVLFYRVDNDGFSEDASKSPIAGSNLPDVVEQWRMYRDGTHQPVFAKQRIVSGHEIASNGYDLTPALYLSEHLYPEGVPLVPLGDLFHVQKGTVGASEGDGGEYPFVTSSAEFRRHSQWAWEGEAICIPTVSSTGHGHASIKNIHYVNGRFAAASIMAVLTAKNPESICVKFFYYYLLAHKDTLLVPLMRGAANVSLTVSKIQRLRVPIPGTRQEQELLVATLLQYDYEITILREQLDVKRAARTESFEEFRCW